MATTKNNKNLYLPPQVRKLPDEAIGLWAKTFAETVDKTAGDYEKAEASAWRKVKDDYQQDDNSSWFLKKESPAKSNITVLSEIRDRFGVEDLHVFPNTMRSELAKNIIRIEEEDYYEVQIIPRGVFYIPGEDAPSIYDDVFFMKMIQNFENNVRGQAIPWDYDHNMSVSAGICKKLYVKEDGLYAAVKWTPKAEAAIKDGEWIYPSVAYADKWTNPNTLEEAECVLINVALTNYPALKGIKKIMQYSETQKNNEFPEKEAVTIEIEHQIEAQETKKEDKNMADTNDKVEVDNQDFDKIRSEIAEVKKQTEEDLAKERTEKENIRKELEILKADKRRNERNVKLNEFLPQAGKPNFKFKKESLSQLQEFSETLNDEQFNAFVNLMNESAGVDVDLKVYGTSEPAKDDLPVEKRAEKIMEEALKLPEADRLKFYKEQMAKEMK